MKLKIILFCQAMPQSQNKCLATFKES